MLCRNTGLSKNAIGAIRVQYQETYVEVSADAVAAMKQELGPDLSLEQGASLTELPGLPDFDASPKGPPPAPASAEPRTPEAKADKKKPPYKARKPKQQGTQRNDDSEARRPAKTHPQRKSDKQQRKDPQKQTEAKPQSPKKKPAKKAANDPSKSLKSRKPRHSSERENRKPRPNTRAGKGGEARPFRKPK
jgi:ATP-dependent RNA helicase DeaD